jgi:hypothetical protein
MRIIFSVFFVVLFILILNCGTSENPVPQLSSISPTSKVSHMPTFQLIAYGTDFVEGAKIIFNGNEKPSTFISSTELSCQIEPDDILAISTKLSSLNDVENVQNASTVPVLVRNPTPGGGDSNSLNFTIKSNHTFSNPRNISNTSGSSWHPTIKVDGDDNLDLAWYDYSPGNRDIFFNRSTDSGSTWSSPVNISNNSGNSWNQTITVDSAGNLNLAWMDDITGNLDIFFSRSTDDGATWSLPVNISNNSGDSWDPDIAVDSTGTLYLVWSDFSFVYKQILFSRSTDNGSTWSLPTNISNNSGSSLNPTISLDSGGNLNLAWSDEIPGNFEILFSRSTDNGSTWSLPVYVTQTSYDSYDPTITADNAGNLNLAWTYATPQNWEIFFSRSTDNGSTWILPVNISNTAFGSYEPTIIVDSAGNLNLAWRDDTTGNDEILFSRSTDNGSTWSLPKNISNTSKGSTYPTITVDSAGNIHLAWMDDTTGVTEIFYCNSIQ